MRITAVRTGILSVPLKKPFKTAVRSVDAVNDVIVAVETDGEFIGYGEAPPTGVITGDTTGAILGAVQDHLCHALVGRDAEDLDGNVKAVEGALVGNTSAKAALDIALHDLWAQSLGAPLYRLFGGVSTAIETDMTISVNEPDEMVQDALDAVQQGYRVLKIKVGKNSAKDFERLKAIRDAVGYEVTIRIDANQGWKPDEAVRILDQLENAGIALELVEQPVHSKDLDGMAYVTARTSVPVVADESIWYAADAMEIFRRKAADIVNIKLMKCGGLAEARRIVALSQVWGAQVMVGSMLEGKVSVTAAAHLAAAYGVVTKIDLDGPLLCSSDPVDGGAEFIGPGIRLNRDAGLGVRSLEGVRWF
ncbi:MAG: dipeptide epimerase [Dethiosulfovibrio peptidovorans]|nr:MAG: dipeptide epimerase [Dethiosulfovibrio peptidovorans]